MASSRFTPEGRQKLREQKLGSKNPMWKGDNVSYRALHIWVQKRLPKPESCQRCFNRPAYDLANVTGKYTRDFSNWKYLCRKCDMWFDGRLSARDKYGRWASMKKAVTFPS